jgi:hypothetical protein
MSDDLRVLFRGSDPADWSLSVPLPAGRIVLDEEDSGQVPSLWLSDEPAPLELWARLRAEHPRSGLWPLLLDSLRFEAERPWACGELVPRRMSDPSTHVPGDLLAGWWSSHTRYDADDEFEPLSKEERLAVTAPFGQRWPGLLHRRPDAGDADGCATGYAEALLERTPHLRLGLVAAARGADALAVAGWTGPTNYTNDTGEVAAVLRDWEDRFGVRVVGAGFAELYLSVAAPPADLDDALRTAAEHFAFCPDNVWQGRHPHTLAGYAEALVGVHGWSFWWD